MSDESIKIDIDVNTAGAEKASQSISALEKQISSLQSAVAALKAPSGRGGSVLDSLQLNSAKVKNMKETATALKSVADGLSAVSRAVMACRRLTWQRALIGLCQRTVVSYMKCRSVIS